MERGEVGREFGRRTVLVEKRDIAAGQVDGVSGAQSGHCEFDQSLGLTGGIGADSPGGSTTESDSRPAPTTMTLEDILVAIRSVRERLKKET